MNWRLEQFGPKYPEMKNLRIWRSIADLTIEENRKYGEAVLATILKLQHKELNKIVSYHSNRLKYGVR